MTKEEFFNKISGEFEFDDNTSVRLFEQIDDYLEGLTTDEKLIAELKETQRDRDDILRRYKERFTTVTEETGNDTNNIPEEEVEETEEDIVTVEDLFKED